MNRLLLELDGLILAADHAAIDISIPLRFDGAQPNCFGAPPATREALTVGGWTGDTRRGGSCNVDVYRFTPHCNGTHTECAGHIVRDAAVIAATVRGGLLPATLVTIEPLTAAGSGETSRPAPAATDGMITARALQAALRAWPETRMRTALVIRTLPNDISKTARQYDTDNPPPFLSLQAAELLVEMNVEHVLVDVPSIDRMADDGALTAHRVFFGLPAESQTAARAQCSVTELVYVPDAAPDGYYLLDLQLPSFMTDAAPSRPLLYRIQNS